MVNYVVFDLWNTLVYLKEGWKTFNFLQEEFNVDRQYWRTHVKPLFLCKTQANEEEFLNDFKNLLELDFNVNLYANTMRKQKLLDIQSVRIYDDVISTIKSLKNNDKKLGIISNQATFYEQCFLNSGFAEIIDTTVFSNRLGVRKPNVEIYNYFIEKTGESSEDILMVGDNIINDYYTPLQIGMDAILLSRDKTHPNNVKTIESLLQVINYI